MKQVLQFMQRVNDVLKTYKSPGQKRPKKRFTPEEMKALATAMLSPEGFTSKDVIAATSYNSPAQANKFLKALEMKGLISLTSQLKKAQEPTRDPDAPETRGRKRRDAEFDMADDPTMMDFGDFDDLDLGNIGALEENNNTMSELEKYIKQQIKEAKNPLAKKMKEIENQGRVAALETKLAAVAEMIEETNGRLTRIDEDNEFADMMDKNAVKEVRKQLKELERAQAKLQKEYDKAAGGRKKKEVMDEDLPVAEDAVENAVDEIELEEDNFALSESVKRMQKLANLKG
jgi:vacuolar-type H+-ATPase subunit I/STV1